MPPDIALLCCIPLSKAEWYERANQSPCGDFVRFVSEKHFNGNLDAAWSIFSHEAAFIEYKLKTFAKRGMAITLRATVLDLSFAASRHENVVVVAHWKSKNPLLSDTSLLENRLETWDAMLTAEEFSSLFPYNFQGTTYTIVCTSNILAETFRRIHPKAMCICSNDPVLAGLALAKLDAAVSLMSIQRIPLWRGLLKAGDLIDSLGR